MDVVQALAARGADPNAVTSDHETPLLLAALEGRVEVIRALAGLGGYLNTPDNVWQNSDIQS